VFHDVSTIQPGADFAAQVGEFIAASDVTLVVIGPTWVSATGPGGRRLQDPEDYVRFEVATALARGELVVPVLVNGAELPRPDQLPDELRDLSSRQAVTLRDTSWSVDVESFARSLEASVGADRPAGWLRSRGAAALVAVVLVAALAGGTWWLVEKNGSDGRTPLGAGTGLPSTSSTSSTGVPPLPPACPSPDASWTKLTTVPGKKVVLRDNGIQIEVVSAATRPSGSSWDLVLEVRGTNVGFGKAGTEGFSAYNAYNLYVSTVMDGVRTATPSCFSLSDGNEQLYPKESSQALVGFDVPKDPKAAELVLELRGSRAIPVTARR
jgi:hypothetical protein